MYKTRKFFALLLTFIMLVNVMPVSVFAEEEQKIPLAQTVGTVSFVDEEGKPFNPDSGSGYYYVYWHIKDGSQEYGACTPITDDTVKISTLYQLGGSDNLFQTEAFADLYVSNKGSETPIEWDASKSIKDIGTRLSTGDSIFGSYTIEKTDIQNNTMIVTVAAAAAAPKRGVSATNGKMVFTNANQNSEYQFIFKYNNQEILLLKFELFLKVVLLLNYIYQILIKVVALILLL